MCLFRVLCIVNRGQFNKTFTSVAIVLKSENNSYTCTLHLQISFIKLTAFMLLFYHVKLKP